ncbi:hypothetical protein [Streptantibioticus cattleyicolor]|uniref:Uncharacterized protein n=1 Tax=Streptantibioticus cattleyicolor (strain ATCC 35852 / DSM 46488 / JCM 4925 / NBRC 14057 / NRRL 8057) TaxID=1003195 RepID=F8JNJ0_STREN|nr:hypothetical protein [Streptantibioticus cattleyicolor]AEW99041.1 hypothetical protein SCATT_p08480 [Streptantibioticus cattleyicolor NRRL 8057 = DSM 46488]CCB71910.1 exported protein of unknown function [Streptantibioticus cattleyicolor NRRL 8057 = DSM 46488]
MAATPARVPRVWRTVAAVAAGVVLALATPPSVAAHPRPDPGGRVAVGCHDDGCGVSVVACGPGGAVVVSVTEDGVRVAATARRCGHRPPPPDEPCPSRPTPPPSPSPPEKPPPHPPPARPRPPHRPPAPPSHVPRRPARPVHSVIPVPAPAAAPPVRVPARPSAPPSVQALPSPLPGTPYQRDDDPARWWLLTIAVVLVPAILAAAYPWHGGRRR